MKSYLRLCFRTLIVNLAVLGSASALIGSAGAAEGISLWSPGFKPSQMDQQGRLVEDWGILDLSLAGKHLASADTRVKSVKLEGVIPAAEACKDYEAVLLTLTAYRAPAFPVGVDVLSAKFDNRSGNETPVKLRVGIPENVKIGNRVAQIGGRAVLLLPRDAVSTQKTREWGWSDDATAIPGWAKPGIKCDDGFTSIRAGIGGVPIHYRFKLDPMGSRKVVLGFCESHWSITGSRPVICQVEGAPAKKVDPLALWGRHMPGAIDFDGKDLNGNGFLEVTILPAPGAQDLNPILNVIWLFRSEEKLDLSGVIAGNMNTQALQYIDAGGPNDQSLYAGGSLELELSVPRSGMQMDFIVASPGGSVPRPGETAWTTDGFRKAALEVWRDWK